MTHNVMIGYQHAGQNAPIFILTSEMNSRAQLPINLHTTCKIYDKMTHNVMVGYQRAGQNAPMSILTSEMNSLTQFCYNLMYLIATVYSNLGQTQHIGIKRYFFIERAHFFSRKPLTRAFLLRSVKNLKIHVIYINMQPSLNFKYDD